MYVFLYCYITCEVLVLIPLLLVTLSFPNEISCLIQWAPVLGDSGWTYTLFPSEETIRFN